VSQIGAIWSHLHGGPCCSSAPSVTLPSATPLRLGQSRTGSEQDARWLSGPIHRGGRTSQPPGWWSWKPGFIPVVRQARVLVHACVHARSVLYTPVCACAHVRAVRMHVCARACAYHERAFLCMHLRVCRALVRARVCCARAGVHCARLCAAPWSRVPLPCTFLLASNCPASSGEDPGPALSPAPFIKAGPATAHSCLPRGHRATLCPTPYFPASACQRRDHGGVPPPSRPR
jgi:hypothetical protein